MTSPTDSLPSPEALPGEQYIPSNGSAGDAFFTEFCTHCARDVSMNSGKDYDDCEPHEVCPIIAASFLGEAHEWRRLDDGGVTCTAFIPLGNPVPTPRCDRTLDMFQEPTDD